MDYDHAQLVQQIVTQELSKLPEYSQRQILSSEENLVKFMQDLGFRVSFQAGAHYGVRAGAHLANEYLDFDLPEPELEASVEIGDALMELIQNFL
ncbi:MAG: hypothetical protein F6K31_07765 [Symploca sp. SIO2G7]|nr:hypothetical protein [Symploca sp. SIO2G7]